ncbi:MAG: hypothetical protein ACKOWK_05970 [Micrococcales bacterium]
MTDQPLTRRQLREQAAAGLVAPVSEPDAISSVPAATENVESQSIEEQLGFAKAFTDAGVEPAPESETVQPEADFVPEVETNVNLEADLKFEAEPDLEFEAEADVKLELQPEFAVDEAEARPSQPTHPMSRRAAREQGYPGDQSSTADDIFGKPIEFDDSQEIEDIQLLATGPIKLLEPTAIVVDAVPDITNMSMILPESGLVIQTGAIDLPWLNTESSEIQVVTEAAAAADAANKREETATGIHPIPARVHERTRRKASVFPNKLRRGWGVVYLTALSAFLLGALFCAFLAAFLLGLIKL